MEKETLSFDALQAQGLKRLYQQNDEWQQYRGKEHRYPNGQLIEEAAASATSAPEERPQLFPYATGESVKTPPERRGWPQPRLK